MSVYPVPFPNSGFEIDTPPETAIERCLQLLHFSPKFVQFSFDLFDLAVDFLNRCREQFLDFRD